jgi:transposase
MDIALRTAADAAELAQRIGQTRNAKQRDRLRAVTLAIDGESTRSIMRMLGRSRGFVQRWCYAYRDDGLDAVAARPMPGRVTKLPADQHVTFKQRVLDGATEADGVCVLRGRDLRGILEREFGVCYTLSGVYELLDRLGMTVLVPRPQHRKSDDEVMRQWVEDAPPFCPQSRA